jgi:hypothetical protein
MLADVALSDDVRRIAAVAAAHAEAGEEVAAVLVAEPHPGQRLYLCAFARPDETHGWLAFDDSGAIVTDRGRVRDAASIAALCEIAEEGAEVELEDPRIASPEYLDAVSARSRNGDFAAALQGALPVVDELAKDVETNYKLELS